MKKILINNTFGLFPEKMATNTIGTTVVVLIIVGIVLLILLSIASLYLIASLRRKNVVMKKVDYLVEDITYKSESLNVTVETLNKLSNYALTMDLVSQKGFKSMVKLVSENRNYIYTIIEKLRNDVDERENEYKKTTPKKSQKQEKVEKKPTKEKTVQIRKIIKTGAPKLKKGPWATEETLIKKEKKLAEKKAKTEKVSIKQKTSRNK